jgi:Protein of unknown function (DUF2874).
MKIIWGIAAATMLAGCAEVRKNMGAANENDQNVLTGGPVSGTRVKDLPQAVRETLKQKVPTAEVADIDKQTLNNAVIYKISFSEPGKNPTLYIGADGNVVPQPK